MTDMMLNRKLSSRSIGSLMNPKSRKGTGDNIIIGENEEELHNKIFGGATNLSKIDQKDEEMGTLADSFHII